jgi:protein-tyrosine phosphatase
MIDIHSHLLPQIDDGPVTWDETMAMVRQAFEDGIKEIAITHHILSNVDYQKERDIINKVVLLKNKMADEAIDIRIHLSSEIYYQPDMELSHAISTYNDNKKYFLVEFPMQGIPRQAAEHFFKLVTEGVIPIIAHPERNMGMIKNPHRAYEFVQGGALLQMNAGSIVGRHGKQVKETAQILLNGNLIHFLGTDAHNTRRRPMKLSDAWDTIAMGWGTERANRLFIENAAKILAGRPFNTPDPLPPQPLKKGFFAKLKNAFTDH